MDERDHLPLYDLPVRSRNGQQWLFDPLRKKEVALTREEYVRQCLILYLRDHKKVPLPLMSVERGTDYHGKTGRYDLVVFNRSGEAVLCAECKAPEVKLDEAVMRQVSVYNATVGARFVIVTNGPSFFVFEKVSNGEWKQQNRLPSFEDWA